MTVAILDACVLYPPSLRDLLMRLAAHGIYSPRWTSEIQTEWVSNVLSDNPSLSQAQLERTCSLMEAVDPDSLVSGYETHLLNMHLPDPKDHHVLAAAIHCSASTIVTYNLSDFPANSLEPHNINAAHPDTFLCALMGDHPREFLQTLRGHRLALKNPPKSTQDYIDTLKVNRLFELALRVEAHLGEL
jgi:PIN domain